MLILDLSCLPCLPLSQVSEDPSFYPTSEEIIKHGSGTAKVQWRTTVTNGVSYIHLKFDITHLSNSLKTLIPLFCRALTSLGTKSQTFSEFDEEIRKNGSIYASCHVTTNPSNLFDSRQYLTIHANGAESNISNVYGLIKKLFQVNWSAKEELLNCIQSEISELSNSVVGNGHVFAMSSASSTLTPSSRQVEEWTGLHQLKILSDVDINSVGVTLAGIADQVFQGEVQGLVISDGLSQTLHRSNLELVFNCINSLAPQETSSDFSQSFEPKNHGMDLGINFVARSFVGVPYSHPDSPNLRVFIC